MSAEPPRPGVGTVIVTYLSDEHIEACVRAAPRPVVVVDNSPRPGRLATEHHPQNLGFAGGVNRGFVLCKEPLVLVLNPDCTLLTGVDAMVAEFAHPRVGAVGGRLVHPRRADLPERTQTGFTVRRFPTPAALAFEVLGINRLFPGNPVNRRYRCLDLDLSQPQSVDQPAGAFLMVRRTAFDAVGGFDGSFHPVWFEDVDFCKRLKLAGWEVRYTPEAVAEHAGGHSVGRLDHFSKSVAWYGSLLKYSIKHHRQVGRFVVAAAVALAALPRGLLGSLRTGSAAPLRASGHVAGLAIQRLILGDFES